MNSASRMCARNGAVLVAAVCLLASVTYAGGPTTLTNGVAVTGLSGALGSDAFYQIVVPSGQDSLEIVTSGGTGDVDLYVKQGAQPTTTSYDYRSWNNGNNETVDVNKPAAGTWYITLHGLRLLQQRHAQGHLHRDDQIPGADQRRCASRAWRARQTMRTVLHHRRAGRPVQAGHQPSRAARAMPTSTSREAALPTTTVYDYRPFLAGNNEAVSIDNPAADTWYIMVQGYAAFSGVTLLGHLQRQHQHRHVSRTARP